MTSDIRVKMCGLRTPEAVEHACALGVAYIGLNFYGPSARSVAPAEAADLAAHVRPGVAKVGLVVNPGDDALDALLARVPLDMIQLHGSEAPERVAEVRARTRLPVIKAVGLRNAGDLPTLDAHLKIADQVLVDAKPAPADSLPGGNGVAFDWRLIAGRRWPVPWLLAGGLTAANVAEAVHLTGARQLDLSSGIETAPGVKDAGLMTAFMKAVAAS